MKEGRNSKKKNTELGFKQSVWLRKTFVPIPEEFH